MSKLLLCHSCSKGYEVADTWGCFPDDRVCRWCRSRNVSIVDPAIVDKLERKGGDFPAAMYEKGKG